MRNKDTKNLQEELMSAPDLDRFLSENKNSFNNQVFAGLLQKLFQKKDISKTALAKRAGMSEVYLYQLFAGGRNPSRDRILCLCFGMRATLEETQALLKESGNAQLYVKDRRDAIIIYGLLHQQELEVVNDSLFSQQEKTLC